MKNLLILLTSCLFFSSCKTDDAEMIVLPEVADKDYAFALVSSAEECNQSLSDGVNCAQTITFEGAKNATVLVTDIQNIAEYTVNGKIITVDLNGGDAGDQMIFEANKDFTELTLTSDGSNDVWKLTREGVDPWDL